MALHSHPQTKQAIPAARQVKRMKLLEETLQRLYRLYGLTDFKALKTFLTNLLHAKSVPSIVINLVKPSVGNIAGFNAVRINSIISAP